MQVQNSPDEDDSSRSRGQQTPTRDADLKELVKEPALSTIVSGVEFGQANEAEGDNEDRHDDQRSVRSTLASSDIEVIKHMDDW